VRILLALILAVWFLPVAEAAARRSRAPKMLTMKQALRKDQRRTKKMRSYTNEKGRRQREHALQRHQQRTRR
jgi:hypothetical protein